MAAKLCDYRCWIAQGKVCRCFCGGVNHGIMKDKPFGFTDNPVLMSLLSDPEVLRQGFTKDQFQEAYRKSVALRDAAVSQKASNGIDLEPEV